MKHQLLTFLVCLILVTFFTTICMAGLTDGLIAYWPLDSDTKDAIGGHDGALGSGAALVNDPQRGQVLDVSPNNGNAFMEVAHADDIAFADSATRTFTISLWTKPANLPRTSWTTVFAKNRPQGGDLVPYGLWISSSNLWHFRVTGTTVNGPAATEEWHHLALRHEAGVGIRGFLDGQEVVQAGVGAGGAGDIELLIGSADKSGFESYPGLIDDFLIYNRALDDAEIQQLASGDSITAVAPQDKLTTAWGAIKQ